MCVQAMCNTYGDDMDAKRHQSPTAQANQWEKYLPLVEHTYNNTIHTITGKTPFEVIEGRPRLPLILKPHEKIFATNEEVRDIQEAFDRIKDSIILHNKSIIKLQTSTTNL